MSLIQTLLALKLGVLCPVPDAPAKMWYYMGWDTPIQTTDGRPAKLEIGFTWEPTYMPEAYNTKYRFDPAFTVGYSQHVDQNFDITLGARYRTYPHNWWPHAAIVFKFK